MKRIALVAAALALAACARKEETPMADSAQMGGMAMDSAKMAPGMAMDSAKMKAPDSKAKSKM